MIKVILVGYMGSGKSIISASLSAKISVEMIDIDQYIEKYTNSTISKIFKEKGDLYFRKLENQTFKKLVETKKSLIISTGGGTPCYYNNHELLKGENITSIYLKASVDTIFNRLKNELNNRPMLVNLEAEDTKEYIAKHLFERSFYYNKAKFTVEVDSKTISQIVDEILILLK